MPKINRKLTETEIRTAKPKDKDYFLFDTGSLRLLVRPSGTKTWQLPYVFNGKNNIHTIGKYGEGADKVGTAEARKICAEVKALLDKGIDPNQHKKGRKREAIEHAENTFQAIAEEWRLKQSWAPKHAKNIKSRLEKDVYNEIGHKPIKDITIPDILDILRKIEGRGALDVARRINQYCTSVFDYGIMQGLCDSNPALGRSKFVKSFKKENRPHLNEKELPDFLKALHGYNDKNLTVLAIKLLVLTFVRPGELRYARWDEFDIKKALWEIPGKRMKRGRDHLVPLSSQAKDVIKEIAEFRDGSELLFPGRIKLTQPISDVALIKMVRKLSKNKASPHGFRHTASTILNEQGFNPDHIERQLSHVEDNKIRGTYNKAEYLDDRRKMMQWWGDFLDRIV